MTDEIRPGVVCIVTVGGWHLPAGAEVEVIAGPWVHPLANAEESFLIRDEEGIQCWAYRSTLRRKPPPGETVERKTEETIPA